MKTHYLRLLCCVVAIALRPAIIFAQTSLGFPNEGLLGSLPVTIAPLALECSVSPVESNLCSEESVDLSVAVTLLDQSQFEAWVNQLTNNGWTLITEFQGHYYLTYDIRMNWSEAKVLCESNGGYLFCVNDSAENSAVSVQVANSLAFGDFWLGAYQDINDPNYIEPSGAWKWLDGAPFSYTNWASVSDGWIVDEPFDSGGENYIMTDWNNMGALWNDVNLEFSGTVVMELPITPIYNWSTGETTPTISVSPAETTTYSVTVTQGNQSCTSEVTITVDQPSTITLEATIDEGEVYDFNGQSLTEPGTYEAVLVNAAGCDSVVTLTLTYAENVCNPLPSNLQQGLVGYWPFCGNANDESGNGNDGVVNGAILTEDRFGNANAAYGFDGEGNNISLNSLVYPASRSISVWFNNSNTSLSSQLIYQASGNVDHYIDSERQLVVQQYPTWNFTSNVNVELNQWYHSVWVFDGNQMKLWVNGNLIYNSQHSIAGGMENISLGSQLNNFGFFSGKLDDIAIWNRALTPEEVQELYTLDACTFTVYDTLTVENVINVYDTLTIENIVDIYDTTYINVEVYDTLTVENIVEVYDTLTIENVIDVYDTTTVVETEVVYDTLTIENIVDVYDTLTIENVIDVYDTTTFVETITVYDTLTVENVVDVYDTTYITVTDTLIIDVPNVPNGVGGNILNTLLLYPNPTSDQLTINYGNIAAMAGYSLSIFNSLGSAVHETLVTQAQETLDISGWSAGVYQVVVYNAGGVPVETRQIVIQ